MAFLFPVKVGVHVTYVARWLIDLFIASQLVWRWLGMRYGGHFPLLVVNPNRFVRAVHN